MGHLKEIQWKRAADISPGNRKWPSCVNTSSSTSSTCRFRTSATSISSIRTVLYRSTSGRKPSSENGTTAFESRRPRSQSLSEKRIRDKIAALETKQPNNQTTKLRNKTEVLAEVVEELVRHKKKAWGELSGRWIAHDTGDNVIDLSSDFLPAPRSARWAWRAGWNSPAPGFTSGEIATARPTTRGHLCRSRPKNPPGQRNP